MRVTELLDAARVAVADRSVATREDVLRLVAGLLAGADEAPAPGPEQVAAALLEREKVGTTAVGDGLAFPHAKLPGLREARAAVLLLPEPGVDLGAPDGRPVRLVLALVVPPDSVGEHLKILAAFSRRLRDPAVRAGVLEADSSAEIVRRMEEIDAGAE
jgi:PTS system nitrogen regulatory IIA component